MGTLFTPPTNFPIKKTQGRRFNYFGKLPVTWSTFGGGQSDGYSPDVFIDFTTKGIQFLNLGSGATNVLEYSFDGYHVDGELNPTNPTVGLTFDNRVVSLIWFRLQSGSSGTVTVSIQAWATQ